MADAPKSHGRHFGFHGREKEFAWLRGMFDAVATKGADGKFSGPRMAVIVAESGIGKSRLVQELYIRLTNDPQWDPPEVDYWPEAFGDGGVNLRAVPDMKGHVPKGPPRFAWLGARWQSPEERNALARRSVLPEVRSSVMVHAEILKSHGSAWADAAARVSESVRKEGVGESIGAAADLVGIPFFGLLSKLAKGAKELVADRMAGPKSFEKVEQEEIKSEVDEVLECMRLLLNGRGAVPTVLWLDDAQWIDDESQVFLHRLWKEAERRKWPLLVVATHWEREWRELAVAERKGDAGDTLHDFAVKDGVEVAVLENADRGALRACVVERLPGLTDAQQSLLVEKAGGNFLTMAENIGELLAEPMWFEGERTDGPLTEDAVAHIREFKTKREDRVRQRFQSLEAEVKKVLGWSTQLGSRFIAEVVEDFAREKLQQADPTGAIEKCVDPYVVLAKPSPLLREFRDKVFHQVASEYRSKFLKADSEKLSAILRRHLVEWVNNSFDSHGVEIWPHEEEGRTAPARSATGLDDEDFRQLLGMAIRELPIPAEPDWTNPHHVAAFRSVYLLIVGEWMHDRQDRVAQLCRQLATVPLESMPDTVISIHILPWVFDAASDAGAYLAAEQISRAIVAKYRLLAEECDTPGHLENLLWALSFVVRSCRDRGDSPGAHAFSEESLAICRRLLQVAETPWRLGCLARILGFLGDAFVERPDLSSAQECYDEAAELVRRLIVIEESPEHLRVMEVNLSGVGRCASARGDRYRARECFEESTAIARRLLGIEETPERLQDMAVSLVQIGESWWEHGDLYAAQGCFQESLGIAQRLLEDRETARNLGGLVACLQRIEGIFMALDEWVSALDVSEECVRICRRLLEHDQTSELLQTHRRCLNRLGQVRKKLGDWDGALASYEEGLEVARRLLETDKSAQRLLDLKESLTKVGEALRARGEYAGALAMCDESLQGAGVLVNDSDAPYFRNILIWSAQLKASCLTDLGRFGAALETLDRAEAAVDELMASCDDEIVFFDTCAAFHEAHAAALAATDRPADSLRSKTRGTQIRIRIERLMAVVRLRYLGRRLWADGDGASALAKFDECLENQRLLVAENETVRRRESLCDLLEFVAKHRAESKDWQGAEHLFRESLATRLLLVDDEPVLRRKREIAECSEWTALMLHGLGELDQSLAMYRAAHGIREQVGAETRSAADRSSLARSFWNKGVVLQARHDGLAALSEFQASLSIRRELARDGGNSEQLEKCLDRCQRLASELGDFRLSHEFASELWEIADDGTLDAGSPRTSEYLISRLVPLMRCQLEFGAASDADRSAARLAQLVDSLLCAFDDSEVDREEEALDSTTLWWCVEGLELIARLRGSQNRARESDAASEWAEQVRTQADALQAEEMQDGESGEADEPG